MSPYYLLLMDFMENTESLGICLRLKPLFSAHLSGVLPGIPVALNAVAFFLHQPFPQQIGSSRPVNETRLQPYA